MERSQLLSVTHSSVLAGMLRFDFLTVLGESTRHVAASLWLDRSLLDFCFAPLFVLLFFCLQVWRELDEAGLFVDLIYAAPAWEVGKHAKRSVG